MRPLGIILCLTTVGRRPLHLEPPAARPDMAHCSALGSNKACRPHPVYFRGPIKLSQQSFHLPTARKCRSSQRSAATVATAEMLDRAQPLDITGFVASNAPNGTRTPDVAPLHPAECHLCAAMASCCSATRYCQALHRTLHEMMQRHSQQRNVTLCFQPGPGWYCLALCSSMQLAHNTWCVQCV